MPITYRLDHDARLIRAAVQGDFTVEEMLDVASSAAAEVGGPGHAILSDAVTPAPSSHAPPA